MDTIDGHTLIEHVKAQRNDALDALAVANTRLSSYSAIVAQVQAEINAVKERLRVYEPEPEAAAPEIEPDPNFTPPTPEQPVPPEVTAAMSYDSQAIPE